MDCSFLSFISRTAYSNNLLKSLLALCLLFISDRSKLEADELDDTSTIIHATQGPLFVSLGSDCLTASMIQHFGKRQTAFPFDWMLTLDEAGFLQILNTNFQDFTNKDYLIRHPITNAGLVHSIYHVEFAHYWLETYWENATQSEEELEKLQITFQRRIEKFRQLGSYKGSVVFIRAIGPSFKHKDLNPEIFWFGYSPNTDEKEFSLNLNDALKKSFPTLDFKLIVVKKTDTQNSCEFFGNIALYHLTDMKEHRHWEPILNSRD
jgi:hypothetical protein